MKYRMLPRARSWVGWHALAPCVVRECAGASLETGSFKTRLGLLARERELSGRALPVCWRRVCIGIVYWSCVRPGSACPDPSCVCGERYQPSCVWRSRVCRRQVCLIKYGILGVQRQDGNGEWCPLSVTWGVFTSVPEYACHCICTRVRSAGPPFTAFLTITAETALTIGHGYVIAFKSNYRKWLLNHVYVNASYSKSRYWWIIMLFP